MMPVEKNAALKKITIHQLRGMTARVEEMVMLTAYDNRMARIIDWAGIAVVLLATRPAMSLRGIKQRC